MVDTTRLLIQAVERVSQLADIAIEQHLKIKELEALVKHYEENWEPPNQYAY